MVPQEGLDQLPASTVLERLTSSETQAACARRTGFPGPTQESEYEAG